MLRGSTAWRRASRGQALVEFAMVIPALALLTVMAIDFGRIYFTSIRANNAAREAAAFGSVNPTDNAGMLNRAQREAAGQAQMGESALALAATCANALGVTIACSSARDGAGSGNTITVAVTDRFTFLLPFVNSFFADNMTVKASATAPVLGYAPGGTGSNAVCQVDPVASFTITVQSGRTVYADPSASTPNSGLCNISGYNWTWGDGEETVGTATGDTHVYNSDGTYSVRLEVTNQKGAGSASRTVILPTGPPPTCTKPVAKFTWTSNGFDRTYQDASTVLDPVNCPITDWFWTFTDKNSTHSNVPNPPTQTYTNNGNHPVTLQVTNAGGVSSKTEPKT